MGCLINRKIVNPHYKKVAPDNHFVKFGHKDDYLIPIACGVCINCINKYKSMWRFRLEQEFKYYSHEQLQRTYFVTLTMSPQYYHEDKPHIALMLRRFLERVRKHNLKSPRHFFITERGTDPDGEKRIHLHGFLMDINFNPSYIWYYWKYGFVKVKPVLHPDFTLSQVISYQTDYITKEAKDGKLSTIVDKFNKPFVFVSPGLGKKYAEDRVNISYHHQDQQLIPFAVGFNGKFRSLPRYLRLKIFTELERETLKNEYFANVDTDVIPDPPYYIGRQMFDDYSLYLAQLKEIEKEYYEIYGKKFNGFIHGLEQSGCEAFKLES